MSCTDETPDGTAVEREVDLPAAPAAVWDALPGVLGDEVELIAEPGGRIHTSGPDGERVGVVEEADAPHRLAFWWTPVEGDDAPSIVELELIPIRAGTRLRVRETRFDADRVLTSFMSAGLARGPRAAARA
jgi:uncharacterized protein YndB with AHSA1/START domain